MKCKDVLLIVDIQVAFHLEIAEQILVETQYILTYLQPHSFYALIMHTFPLWNSTSLLEVFLKHEICNLIVLCSKKISIRVNDGGIRRQMKYWPLRQPSSWPKGNSDRFASSSITCRKKLPLRNIPSGFSVHHICTCLLRTVSIPVSGFGDSTKATDVSTEKPLHREQYFRSSHIQELQGCRHQDYYYLNERGLTFFTIKTKCSAYITLSSRGEVVDGSCTGLKWCDPKLESL